MTAHAHITWDATSLAADFAATIVQRLHPSGWFDIFRIGTEATVAADDYEARLGVEESYRVLVEDIYGIRSPAPSPVTVTLPEGNDVLLTSNQSPAGNTAISFETLDVGLPELVAVTPTNGRYGQRVQRSSDNLGETLSITLDLFDAEGPDLWRTIIARLRADLPYLCVLSPTGHRWFVGEASASVGSPKFDHAHAPISLVEITDTPAVVSS